MNHEHGFNWEKKLVLIKVLQENKDLGQSKYNLSFQEKTIAYIFSIMLAPNY